MNIFTKTVLAGALALSFAAPVTAQAAPIAVPTALTATTDATGTVENVHYRRYRHSHRRSHKGAVAAGVALGIIGAAVIANESKKRRRHYDSGYSSSAWERHVARCYRAYRSYNERTDTFIGYDGIERRCRK